MGIWRGRSCEIVCPGPRPILRDHVPLFDGKCQLVRARNTQLSPRGRGGIQGRVIGGSTQPTSLTRHLRVLRDTFESYETSSSLTRQLLIFESYETAAGLTRHFESYETAAGLTRHFESYETLRVLRDNCGSYETALRGRSYEIIHNMARTCMT